jgi:uncharacterized protein YbjT (DUF2867 family)
MTDDALEVVAQRLLKKHPNTYTLTKAMAEWVVAEQADDIPAAIVRPSIGMSEPGLSNLLALEPLTLTFSTEIYHK